MKKQVLGFKIFLHIRPKIAKKKLLLDEQTIYTKPQTSMIMYLARPVDNFFDDY